MRIKISVLCILILSSLNVAQMKSDILASNAEVATYDSLIQVLRDSYLPVIKQVMADEGKNIQEAVSANDIPEELFHQLAKSLIVCNLFHKSLNKDGDLDIYGGMGLGWMVQKQMRRRLPKPWWTLTRIKGYVLVEVLDDFDTNRLGFRYAECKIIDDVLSSIESDTIIVSHIENWNSLEVDNNDHQQILLKILPGAKMLNEKMERINVYYVSGDIVDRSKYCQIIGDVLIDKDEILYKSFPTFSGFKNDINNFVDSLRHE